MLPLSPCAYYNQLAASKPSARFVVALESLDEGNVQIYCLKTDPTTFVGTLDFICSLLASQCTIADSISHLWPGTYMHVTLTLLCRCSPLSVSIVMTRLHIHCHLFTEIVSLILTQWCRKTTLRSPLQRWKTLLQRNQPRLMEARKTEQCHLYTIIAA